MKNRRKSVRGILVLALLMAMFHAFPVFADSWQQQGNKWRWVKDDGSYLVSCWQWIDGDQDGVSECYYFDKDGYMLSSTTTPDGYQVDELGEWIQNGALMIKIRGDIKYPYGPGNMRANDFEHANFCKMTNDQWKETKNAIEAFRQQYIKDGMSDLEKEIRIIEWLVGNCSYEKGEDWSRGTAYSCIVLGKAQCSGYADAFLQTAKLCGLDVRYVYNERHAWNLIKLDGDWYHVDVTWEDPIGKQNYGFGNLSNRYINLTDDQIRAVEYHSTWETPELAAAGTKYGPAVVAECLAKESRQ